MNGYFVQNPNLIYYLKATKRIYNEFLKLKKKKREMKKSKKKHNIISRVDDFPYMNVIEKHF